MKIIKLKSILTVTVVLAALSLGSQVQAQDFGGRGYGPGPGMFVDENGDGINDLAPDADGDGIPNGRDDDYVRPADGTGYGPGECTGEGGFGYRHGQNGYGPHDGAGYGPGDCTGEGPMGAQHRGGPKG